jgi:hypothetical protein
MLASLPMLLAASHLACPRARTAAPLVSSRIPNQPAIESSCVIQPASA